MEENTKNRIAYANNLKPLNFNVIISSPIDNNVNIKSILNLHPYIYDQKVDCGNGKAIISGKIGLKVLYIDTDNMTNTLTAFSNFSETFVDNLITTDTHLNIFNTSVTHTLLSADSSLKVSCEIVISPIAYLNLGLSTELNESEMLVTKKKEISTTTIKNFINTQFEYATNLETKDNINKILCSHNHLTPEKVVADNGFIVVEGKILSSVVYETQNQDETLIKEIKEISNFKCDVEVSGVEQDELLDLSFCLDNENENISTEVENDLNSILIKHTIKVCGISLKPIKLEVVDDLFSTTHEIDISASNRECSRNAERFALSEVVSNEITLSKEETAIDDVIANMNISPEITNTYIKEDFIYIEGIITSNLSYVDENKEYKTKTVEIPFIINSKINASNLGCTHHTISILDSKVKVKRGTIIELEYSIFITLTIYEKENHQIIDNFTLGKPLNFGNYDFQIFIAKPEETIWDLCKRTKISPNDITKYNKDLPLVCSGGERIVIRR